MSWPSVPLGNVLREVRRPVNVESEGVYREIGIRSHGRGIFHKEAISGLLLGDKKVFHICPGDFVVNIVFAWEGAVAIAGEGERGRIGSHRFPTFLHDPSALDPRFLLHYLRTEAGLAMLLRVSPGGAGRNRTLSRQAFLRQSIPLPSIVEQQAIVQRLDQVESALGMVESEWVERDRLMRAALLRAVHGPSATPFPRVRLAEVAKRADHLEKVAPGRSYAFAGAFSFGRGLFDAGPKIAGHDFKYASLVRLQAGHLVYPKLMAWEGAFAVVPPEFAGYYVSPEFVQFELTGIDANAVDVWFRSKLVLPDVRAASSGTNMRRRRLQPGAFLKLRVPHPDSEGASVVRDLVGLRNALAADRDRQRSELALLRARAVAHAFVDGA